MNPIFSAALEIQDFCREHDWRFCFIGALAVQRWGEPRLTQDVDLTSLSGLGAEARYIEDLLRRFSGRITEAREFALKNRLLLLQSSGGIPLDVSLGALPFEERVIWRPSPYPIDPPLS